MQRMREKWHDSINGLTRKFRSVYQFCNDDLNKFILLLRKVVYPYEDMNNWEKSDKSQYRLKKQFTAN